MKKLKGASGGLLIHLSTSHQNHETFLHAPAAEAGSGLCESPMPLPICAYDPNIWPKTSLLQCMLISSSHLQWWRTENHLFALPVLFLFVLFLFEDFLSVFSWPSLNKTVALPLTLTMFHRLSVSFTGLQSFWNMVAKPQHASPI